MPCFLRASRGSGPVKTGTFSCETSARRFAMFFEGLERVWTLSKRGPIHVKRRARQYAMFFKGLKGVRTLSKRGPIHVKRRARQNAMFFEGLKGVRTLSFSKEARLRARPRARRRATKTALPSAPPSGPPAKLCFRRSRPWAAFSPARPLPVASPGSLQYQPRPGHRPGLLTVARPSVTLSAAPAAAEPLAARPKPSPALRLSAVPASKP